MSEHHSANVRAELDDLENALRKCGDDNAMRLNLLDAGQRVWESRMARLEAWAAKGSRGPNPVPAFNASDLAFLRNEMARRRVALIASMKTEAA